MGGDAEQYLAGMLGLSTFLCFTGITLSPLSSSSSSLGHTLNALSSSSSLLDHTLSPNSSLVSPRDTVCSSLFLSRKCSSDPADLLTGLLWLGDTSIQGHAQTLAFLLWSTKK